MIGCGCALDAIEDEFTLSEFTAFERTMYESGALPSWLAGVVADACGTDQATGPEDFSGAAIVGTTDTDPDHWTQASEMRRFEVPVFGEQPSIIEDPNYRR